MEEYQRPTLCLIFMILAYIAWALAMTVMALRISSGTVMDSLPLAGTMTFAGLLLFGMAKVIEQLGLLVYNTSDKEAPVEYRPKKIRISQGGQDIGEMELAQAKMLIKSGKLGFSDYYFDEIKNNWLTIINHPELKFAKTEGS